jgi:hypothetical protein
MPDAQADLFNFRYALPNLTESLKKQRNIRIVAIGSSSTAGEADVLPYRHGWRCCCATVFATA